MALVFKVHKCEGVSITMNSFQMEIQKQTIVVEFKAEYPMAPLVLALVLGPLMEKSFRQTLISEQGNIMAFIERPLSGTFIAISAIFFLLPLLKYVKRANRTQRVSNEPAK